MPVTVAEIARACGLSKGTVANILSGRGGYAAKTRELVARTARARGFTPGRLGRSLRDRSAPIVGVLVGGSLEDPFTAELLQAISNSLRPLEVDTMVRLDHWATADDLRASYQAMLSWRPRAIVPVAPWGLQRAIAPAERKRWLAQSTIVNVHADPWPESWSVDVDREAIARLAIDHLAGLGHQRIALLDFAPEPTHFKYRYAMAALRRAGLRFHREDLIHCGYPSGDEAGEGELQRLYESGRQLARNPRHPRHPRPTALFSWSDSLVAPFLAGFCNSGGRIPQDLAVVTVSESRILSRLAVPLTSVGVEVHRTAQAVAELLTKAWADRATGDVEPAHVRLEPTLMRREST